MSKTPASDNLHQRGLRVLSPGQYGGLNAQAGNPLFPDGTPKFFERAHGARVWDVDDNEYIDLLCAMGPNLLGYGDPHVESAAERQRSLADTLAAPTSVMVELAEDLVDLVAHADWALFAKNGVDVTSAAVHIARAHTGKSTVLRAAGGYHGAHPWCLPETHISGILPGERGYVLDHEFNDTASLEAAVERADGQVAAILVSAYKHHFSVQQEELDPTYARRCREIADSLGALLIVDDIRAGLRITRGCSWEIVGVHPDLSCWSQAIANGYAISALLGSNSVREASGQVVTTGTYWTQSVPMAAARATLERVRTTDYLEHTIAMGKLFREGLEEKARERGHQFNITGPAQMPMVHFANDPDLLLAGQFASGMIRSGVLIYPHHNLFMCSALTTSDVEEVVEKADSVLRRLPSTATSRGRSDD